MSNEIAEVQRIDDEQLIKYLDLFQSTSGITETEKGQFLEIAKMSNLNPFKREIYITAYGSGNNRKCTIITGYEVFIKRAEMSGLLNGWSTKIEKCLSVVVNDNGSISEIKDIKAIITIHRKDFDQPFTHEVKFSEYVQKTNAGAVNKFWKTKPETMLKKVAISQGFRMCFNEILGGMPYTKDEIADENQTIDIAHVDNKINSSTANIEELFSDAKTAITENKSGLEGLTFVWDSFPDLHGNSAFKQLMSKSKKEIEDSVTNKQNK